MKNRISGSYLMLVALLWLVLATPACATFTNQPAQPAKPVAAITAPQAEANLTVGQEVMISFTAADVKGISQIELSIDGEAVHIETVNPPVNSFAATQPWTPNRPGSHVIELRAFNIDNEPSDPVQLFLTVNEVVGAATPPPAADTPTLPPVTNTPEAEAPAAAAPTATGVELIPPTPTLTPTVTAAIATMRTGLNVRTGPGLDYPVIGRLTEGESVQITGRNPETTWWQIVYPANSNERGWISADPQFSTVSGVEGVAVAEAPPPPTPVPVTPTPEPVKPTIHYFRANRESINPGEEVELSWDLAGAKEAFLRYDDVTEGVVAPGSKEVSPDKTTKYTLLARNDAGDTIAELTINVSGAPTPTPVPVLRDGKTALVNGQSIDFDQGVVQQGRGQPGADFYWNGEAKSFSPEGGASGALLNRDYQDVTLADCRAADYGQPVGDLAGSTKITGCYRTNEGRYGKFSIVSWDLAGNLTVEWLTWNYR